MHRPDARISCYVLATNRFAGFKEKQDWTSVQSDTVPPRRIFGVSYTFTSRQEGVEVENASQVLSMHARFVARLVLARISIRTARADIDIRQNCHGTDAAIMAQQS